MRIFRGFVRVISAVLFREIWQIPFFTVGCSHHKCLFASFCHISIFQYVCCCAILLWDRDWNSTAPFSYLHHLSCSRISSGIYNAFFKGMLGCRKCSHMPLELDFNVSWSLASYPFDTIFPKPNCPLRYLLQRAIELEIPMDEGIGIAMQINLRYSVKEQWKRGCPFSDYTAIDKTV